MGIEATRSAVERMTRLYSTRYEYELEAALLREGGWDTATAVLRDGRLHVEYRRG